LLLFWYEDYDIHLSKSTDNGISWSSPVLFTSIVYSAQNSLTGIVLNSGRIVIVYKTTYYNLVYSDDNGNTWSSPQKLPAGSNGSVYNGNLSQSSSGKLFLTYYKSINLNANNISYITSNDSGLTWSSENTFISGPVYASIASAGNNKLIIAYQNQGLYSSISTNDGISWSVYTAIVSNDTTVYNPKVVYDKTGKLWLFYQRNIPSPFPDIKQQDILFRNSTDGGLTWGAENNFTTYKGVDYYYNVSANGNYPLVSFSSDRRDSSMFINNIWYGIAGITQDNDAPPYLYKYKVSNSTPLTGQHFNISTYLDCAYGISNVFLNREINGVVQTPLTMYDDGTHGDTISNDKIYTCEVPGLNNNDALETTIKITDQLMNTGIYRGPVIIISPVNLADSVIIDVNKFKLQINNSGILAHHYVNGYQMGGGYYDDKLVLFDGGFFLSGRSEGTLWSNGQASQPGITDYVPGKVGSLPGDPRNMLYIVRSTDPPFGPSWQNWKYAVSQGAGFYDGNKDGIFNPIDLNGNGKWDPNEDRPDLLGDITAWCVYNDGLPASGRYFNNVNPQGIEIQQTVFAQKDSADLNNVIFIRYRIINRGIAADVLDSVYFGLSNDADIGDNGGNDLVGCDTLLNSGYTYHKVGAADMKFGNNPPAVLISLLQGPQTYIPGVTFNDINNNGVYDPGIDIALDSAYSLNGPLLGKTIVPGAKNLAATTFEHYYGGSSPVSMYQERYFLLGKDQYGNIFDPCLYGQGQVLGGINCANINPSYMYSGDPVTQTGWVNTTPQDQQLTLNTGPFKLEKDKPVDIMAAYVVGRGSDYLNSITITKDYAASVIRYYSSNFPNSIITGIKNSPNTLTDFRLYQNYPNPFNPSTRIRYSISTNSLVTIKVYDILGKELAVILNEQKHPGEYEIEFNAGKYSLASGVYFYRLTAGSFISNKKMVLIK